MTVWSHLMPQPRPQGETPASRRRSLPRWTWPLLALLAMPAVSLIQRGVMADVPSGPGPYVSPRNPSLEPPPPLPADAPTPAANGAPLSGPLEQVLFPGQDWAEQSLEAAGIDAARFQQAVDYAFSTSGTEEDRAGIRTDGLVVIYRGALVFERYARGYTRDMRHYAWSVSKSITSALVGIAVQQGKLKIEDPAWKFYPSLKRPEAEAITVGQLLQMSSGLAWKEGYEASPLDSSVLAMLYTAGRQDMAAYAASQPMAHSPGTFWYYSSGTTNLVSALLKQAVGTEAYGRYPWEQLFDPLGMRSAVLEQDQAGTFVGSSYLHATPRDLARFGYLYLRDGVWNGQRMLPEGWVTWSRSLAPSFAHMDTSKLDFDDRYGAMWWLNVPLPGAESADKKRGKPWPDAPDDTFSARGHWGQYITVIPSRELVVVRTGDDRDGSFNANELLRHLLSALPQGAPQR